MARRQPRPTLAAVFDFPSTSRYREDLFGIGSGLSGLCPRPAVAAFIAVMLAGTVVHQRFVARA